jgi:NO-binding membrane sensor protein with MHYT domain
MKLKKDHVFVVAVVLAVLTTSMALILTVSLIQKKSGLYVERISGKKITLVYANYSSGTGVHYSNMKSLVTPKRHGKKHLKPSPSISFPKGATSFNVPVVQ